MTETTPWSRFAAKRRYDHLRAGDKLDRADRDFVGHREWNIGGNVTRRRTWRSGSQFYTPYMWGKQVVGEYSVGEGMIVAQGYTGG